MSNIGGDTSPHPPGIMSAAIMWENYSERSFPVEIDLYLQNVTLRNNVVIFDAVWNNVLLMYYLFFKRISGAVKNLDLQYEYGK